MLGFVSGFASSDSYHRRIEGLGHRCLGFSLSCLFSQYSSIISTSQNVHVSFLLLLWVIKILVAQLLVIDT